VRLKERPTSEPLRDVVLWKEGALASTGVDGGVLADTNTSNWCEMYAREFIAEPDECCVRS